MPSGWLLIAFHVEEQPQQAYESAQEQVLLEMLGLQESLHQGTTDDAFPDSSERNSR